MGPALVAAALLAGALLCAIGYAAPSAPAFFAGLLTSGLAAGPLTFAARARLPGWALRAGLGLAASAVALLAVEGVWRAAERLVPEPPIEPVLTYRAARADPAAFHRWWTHRAGSFVRTLRSFAQLDPRGLNPYVLKPDHSFTRYRSQVHINRLGFRGPEIGVKKGERFRIVALGESTTFGITLLDRDRPWPEVLEARIRGDFTCDAPVQVINAGVPGWNLGNQLLRLPHDILPLDPDWILTYHGYNGFDLFLTELPAVRVHAAPEPPERPSRLLGALEREIRLRVFRRRYAAARGLALSVDDVDARDNAYFERYASLVETARGAGVETLLSTFNMAVNAGSPEDAIRFYEASVPDVRARIVANQIHTRVVRAIGERYGSSVIDSSEGLDGAYRDAYVDIAHFTQLGRERLADNLLRGLAPLLAAHPRLRCRPSGDAAARGGTMRRGVRS